MQFLAITKRDTQSFTSAQFDEILPAEADQARALFADGTFRAIHSRGDVPGAVIVVEAANAEEAARYLATLPMAAKGMMAVEIIPLKPYRGFIGG